MCVSFLKSFQPYNYWKNIIRNFNYFLKKRKINYFIINILYFYRKSSKSNESLYSSSSSKYSAGGIYRKPDIMKQASFIPGTTNDIRQRVLSARRLRVKSLQNQLAAAQHTINVNLVEVLKTRLKIT